MIPNLTAILIGDTATNAIVSGKVYRTFKDDPVDASAFIVWSIVSGSPENYLAGAPEIDDARFQIDSYAKSQATARRLSEAAQAVLEPLGYVVMGPTETHEDDTLLWRWSFDLELWTARA